MIYILSLHRFNIPQENRIDDCETKNVNIHSHSSYMYPTLVINKYVVISSLAYTAIKLPHSINFFIYCYSGYQVFLINSFYLALLVM